MADYLSCCLFINIWWGDVWSFSVSFYSHMWFGGTVSYFFDEETCYHFLCHFIHICDLVVPCHIFLFEVLSLQVFFTVCFLKFILSYILNFRQIEIHNASTPWGLLPSHHIASSMNIVKVRDIPEKLDRRIRTGAIFLYDWNVLILYDWNDLFLGTGAWGREHGKRERGETEPEEQWHVWIAEFRRELVDENCGDGSHGDGSCGDGSLGDGSLGDGSRGDGSRGDGSHGDRRRGEGSPGDGSRGDGSRGDGSRAVGTVGHFGLHIFLLGTYFFAGHGKWLFVL